MPYENAHRNPQGPGDARPIALDIIKDQGLEGKLRHKTALITGGTGGIGLETARALHATGAKVFITGRQIEKGQAAAKSLSTGTGPAVEMIEMRLDSFDSIKAGVKTLLSKSKQLDILICNAGVMACPYSLTKDGIETQFGVNYLSHFLLFQLLALNMTTSATSASPSRVITLSSCAHRGTPFPEPNPIPNGTIASIEDIKSHYLLSPYNPGQSYAISKTAMIYLASQIHRHHHQHNITAFSVHPGFILTDLIRHISTDPFAQEFINAPEARGIWKSAEQGAATSVWAAVGKELEGKGGGYLEDCRVGREYMKGDEGVVEGYKPGYEDWAFDERRAEGLWRDSLVLCGLE